MNKKEILIISITIFMTVIAILIADIYHASTKKQTGIRANIPAVKVYNIDKNILETLSQKSQ